MGGGRRDILACIKCCQRPPRMGKNKCALCIGLDADDTSECDAQTAQPKYVCDELLMYVCNMLHCATKAKIADVVSIFFTDEEVRAARQCLIAAGSDMRGRTSIPLMVGDIVAEVDRCSSDETNLYQFVALRWTRLPKNRPEEASVVAQADQAAELVAHFDAMHACLEGVQQAAQADRLL